MYGPDGTGWNQTSTWHAIGRSAQIAGAYPSSCAYGFTPNNPHAFASAEFAGLERAIEICATLSHDTGGGRSETDRKSGQVTAGLMLLLALCGWIVDGEAGAKRALTDGLSNRGAAALTPDEICNRFAARPLCANEAPGLLDALRALCCRAGMSKVPDIYVLPREAAMNAYALGQRDRAVIVLTDGLLRGMTQDEVAAILAHEIAHIYNDDGWTLTQATSLRQAINRIAAGLHWSTGTRGRLEAPRLAWLVYNAPAIAELLCLGLSRLREFAADALALQLVQDSRALTSALEKLERHHRFANAIPLTYSEDRLSSYLRSHPETSVRVSELRAPHRYAC